MKTLTEHLTQYARYHRNQKNIATHFVGIPMIVLAVVVLLARVTFELAGLPISIATVLVILASTYYIKLDLWLGYVLSLYLLLCLWVGQGIAEATTVVWLSYGLGLFIVGWVFQFIGHYFEGRKPAFVDDIMGLMIGPLFVVAELAFKLGFRKELHKAIEARLRA